MTILNDPRRARTGRARRIPLAARLADRLASDSAWMLAARALSMLIIFTGIFFISLGFLLSLYQSAGTIAAIWESPAASAAQAETTTAAPSGRVEAGEGFVPVQISDVQSSGQAPAIPQTGSAEITSGRISLISPDFSSDAAAANETRVPEIAAQPASTPTPEPIPPGPPDRLVIPVIALNAPVKPMPIQRVTIQGQVVEQWLAPAEFAAGWQEGSAQIGAAGNTVLNGHHNIHGSVFSHLRELLPGDSILVYSGEHYRHYVVSQVMILEERNATLEQRLDNARWVLPSTDERLTLVTCWPPESNTHRLVVVAVPSGN